MVACQAQYRAAAREELLEHFLQMAYGVAQSLRPGQFAKEVASDEQQLDLLRAAITGDLLDGAAQVLRPVDAAEPIA